MNVKLRKSFLDSDVWAMPDSVRLVWLTMMFMADDSGFVGAGVLGIARRAGVDGLECQAAIEHLCEGNQPLAAPILGGWRMVNYERFVSTQTDRQEANAAAAARYRAKKAAK